MDKKKKVIKKKPNVKVKSARKIKKKETDEQILLKESKKYDKIWFVSTLREIQRLTDVINPYEQTICKQYVEKQKLIDEGYYGETYKKFFKLLTAQEMTNIAKNSFKNCILSCSHGLISSGKKVNSIIPSKSIYIGKTNITTVPFNINLHIYSELGKEISIFEAKYVLRNMKNCKSSFKRVKGFRQEKEGVFEYIANFKDQVLPPGSEIFNYEIQYTNEPIIDLYTGIYLFGEEGTVWASREGNYTLGNPEFDFDDVSCDEILRKTFRDRDIDHFTKQGYYIRNDTENYKINDILSLFSQEIVKRFGNKKIVDVHMLMCSSFEQGKDIFDVENLPIDELTRLFSTLEINPKISDNLSTYYLIDTGMKKI